LIPSTSISPDPEQILLNNGLLTVPDVDDVVDVEDVEDVEDVDDVVDPVDGLSSSSFLEQDAKAAINKPANKIADT
jgi:hypothetical protein